MEKEKKRREEDPVSKTWSRGNGSMQSFLHLRSGAEEDV